MEWVGSGLARPLTDCSSEPVEPHTKTLPGVEGLLAIQHSWPGKPKLAKGEIYGVKSLEKPWPIVLPICNFKAHSWHRKYVCPLCSVQTCSLIINPQRIKGKDSAAFIPPKEMAVVDVCEIIDFFKRFIVNIVVFEFVLGTDESYADASPPVMFHLNWIFYRLTSRTGWLTSGFQRRYNQ